MDTEQRVLVLDDDPAVGEMVIFISEDLGFESRAVTDPVEFLDLYDEWKPSHIVLDLVMPKMDGVEVMRYLAKRDCRARIIISSGVGGRVLDAAQRTAKQHGLRIEGVLSKPFSPSALKAFLSAGSGPGRQPAAPAQVAEPGDSDPITVDEQSLLLALQNQEFKVVYQPIVVCATGAIACFEALARWEHPAGTVMPDRFIPVAESLDLIDQITRQIFSQAAGWLALTYPDQLWCLSLNISSASLGNERLADRLEKLCRDAGLEPARVILELTETAAMKDPVIGLELLTRLRMKGFHLSIDDFGTGYSSLAQLARMPFSELKVDKSFVMEAHHSAEARTIIHSMVDLGHNMGLRVVAEGVEDEQTVTFLRHIGCDFIQGYHIARPAPTVKLEAWVKEHFAVNPQP